jgi:hypothetical protein
VTEPKRWWSVVKANIAEEGADREEDLNEWWNDHLGEYVAKPGFKRGWRMRARDADGSIGAPPHRYHAIYEVDSVASFNRALDEGTDSHPGDPWGPWQEYVDQYVLDWERTYYRVISRHVSEDRPGAWWAVVKADVELADQEAEARFDEWYTGRHMPEICGYPGVHRGVRLEVEPDDNDLGNRRQRFWGVYEVDEPAAFAAARADRAERGIEPWDGIWLPLVSNFEISFYEVLVSTDHDEAVRTRSHSTAGSS